jgi:hypothetical protein
MQEPAVSLSEERSAKNEALFRDANEQLEKRRIEVLGADDPEPTPFLCECDDLSCTQVLMISLEEYERARDSGRRFTVAPGHTDGATVIARDTRFWIVEKDGDAARVAEEHDPRARAVEEKLREREERIGKNEILLREVNERIEEIGAEAFGLSTIGFVCECGDASCTQQVKLQLREYESVRKDARRFFTLPGHEAPEVESVVELHDRYQVVEKHDGLPGELAARNDPR